MSPIVEVTINQVQTFKTLIGVLKNIIPPSNLIFCPAEGKNPDYIKIFYTNYEYMLVDVKLDYDFNKFHCQEKTSVGINWIEFYDKLKEITRKTTLLTLRINSETKDMLDIVIHNEYGVSDEYIETKINTLNLPDKSIVIPSCDVDMHIIISSLEFHRACSSLAKISDLINFRYACDLFELHGSCGNTKKSIKVRNNQITNTNPVNNDISNIILLNRDITPLAPLASLGTCVEIFVKRGNPFTLKYPIASMGRMFVCVNPVEISEQK